MHPGSLETRPRKAFSQLQPGLEASIPSIQRCGNIHAVGYNLCYRGDLVTCLVAFPSSTCLAFCPNSSVLMVSRMLDSRGLTFTNMQAYNVGKYIVIQGVYVMYA